MEALWELADLLRRAGADLELIVSGSVPVRVGCRLDPTRVVFHRPETLLLALHGDHLALAEAYLTGQIDVEGDLLEVMKLADALDLEPAWLDRLRLGLRLLLRDRIRYDRESIAFHYDRPVEFFLPWLDRWRCYSHGLYEASDDDLTAAQERKLQCAMDSLRLERGMRVLDMGAGWGCFMEYAGLRGIRVHGITISKRQYDFTKRLIRELDLPCAIELVNLREFRPSGRFDAAVFMGTFEHVPEYERVARFLARHLAPEGRVWADFCAQRDSFVLGRFMKKYIWPGPIQYVNPHRLVAALIRSGFNIHEMRDDTLSYAYTVRAWGDALEARRGQMAKEWGEETLRAFLLFLRGSDYFLSTNRTQAYHLVAGRQPAVLQSRSVLGSRAL